MTVLRTLLSSYQRNQVPGVFATEVSTTAEDDQRHEEDRVRHVICPRVTSHKVLGLIDEGEDGDEGERDQQLHREDHEDLVGKYMLLVVVIFYIKILHITLLYPTH